MSGVVAARTMDSPIGPLRVSASASGIREIRIGGGAGEAPVGAGVGALDLAERELRAYFEGARGVFTMARDAGGTEFQRDVWAALMEIPAGQTRSYADVARAIGRPSAVRAVARANATNPLPIIVPCHRVIGSDGTLTGYGGGLAAKRWLLDHERRWWGAGLLVGV